MSITLTCTCGQRQFIANELAGQAIACVTCGNALQVPAMGRLLPERRIAKPHAAPRPPAHGLLIFLAAGVVFLATAGGGWLAWEFLQRRPTDPVAVAEHKRAAPVEKPGERPRPAPEKKETPVIVPSLSKETPKHVEPVTPMPDPPRPIAVPIKPMVLPIPPKIVLPKPGPIQAKKPAAVVEPLKLVWKLREGDTFFQELIVTQKPTFKVSGLPIASLLNYRIVSRFTVKKRSDDGARIVEQKIESAKLLLADDLTRSTVDGAFAKLPGTTYTLHLSPKMDVTKLEGAAAGVNVANLGLGLQMASLIDRDGWRELAQATFFQLDQTPQANLRWSKPMTHQWGALGSWHGQVNYAYLGTEKNLHKISYGMQLAHKAPMGGAIGLMTVNSANFKAPQAGGLLFFDTVQGRVIAAEERFRAQGLINANVLGQNTLIEIDEDQHFSIRIHDRQP